MMMRLQNFSRCWIVGRKQRQRAEVAEEVGQPEAADGNGHDHIGKSQFQGVRKIRLDDPEQVEITHQDEPDCEPDQFANVALE